MNKSQLPYRTTDTTIFLPMIAIIIWVSLEFTFIHGIILLMSWLSFDSVIKNEWNRELEL